MSNIVKEQLPGIILVISCHKHQYTRLEKYKLPKNEYAGWKVIYILGNPLLSSEYQWDSSNQMTIKCEDSYIHLMKKVVLSIKILYDLYDIQEGILRCGDDLVFNEDVLEPFLKSKKFDFMGQSPTKMNCLQKDMTPSLLKRTRMDPFMLQYYSTHTEDFNNPQHNLKGVDIRNYMKRPEIPIGPAGVLYYMSNSACATLISHMEQIQYDIFHLDTFTQSYPYTIEDCAVAYILYFHKFSFIHVDHMYSNFPSKHTIVYHTNHLK